MNYLALPLDSVIASPEPVLPAAESAPLDLKGNKVARTLVTVRTAEALRDYEFRSFCALILAHGPGLLEAVQGRQRESLPNEENWGRDALYVDVPNRALWACGAGEFFGGFGTVDRRCEQAIESRWPGWKAHVHGEGIAYQVELSGRDSSIVRISKTRAVDRLRTSLVRAPICLPADPASIEVRERLFDSAVSGLPTGS
jgi:hypothetical protein